MSEKCDRCGSVGSDRRTLTMACFYAMEEVVPSLKRAVMFEAPDDAKFEIVREPARVEIGGGRKLALDSGEVRCDRPMLPAPVYRLRCCKRCRGEWLDAVRRWFSGPPSGLDHDADEPGESPVGSGIFVRENGAIREINEEEWRRRHPDREPARAKP